jgi:hypothetical protein
MTQRLHSFLLQVYVLLVCGMLLLPGLVQAQDDGTFSVEKYGGDKNKKKESTALKALIIGLNTGYGRTSWNHTIANSYLATGSDQGIYSGTGSAPGYVNLAQGLTTIGPAGSAKASELTYIGKGSAIPFTLDLMFAINNFRIGLSGTYEFSGVKSLVADAPSQPMRDIALSGKTKVLKYGLVAEYLIAPIGDADIGLQVRAGSYSMLGDYDKAVVQKKLALGAGIIAEYPLSELFYLYANPYFEHRKHSTDKLENDLQATNSINTIYLNVGVRARLENLFVGHPLCPIPSCHSRKIHMHNGHTYRGQPWYKKQNPHIGESLPPKKKNKTAKPYVVKDPEEAAKDAAKMQEKRQKGKEKAEEKATTLEEKEARKQGKLKPEEGAEGDTAPDAPAEETKSEKKKEKKERKAKDKEPAEEEIP